MTWSRSPATPRTGDSKAIRDSLRRYGQFRALVVGEHDGKLTILAGTTRGRRSPVSLMSCQRSTSCSPHGRRTSARDAYRASGELFREQFVRGEARCEVIECSDDEAGRINAADNKYGEMPDPETGERYDADLLAELLAGFDGDFGGTGWTADEFDALTDPGTSDPLPDEGDADTDDDLEERWGVIVE